MFSSGPNGCCSRHLLRQCKKGRSWNTSNLDALAFHSDCYASSLLLTTSSFKGVLTKPTWRSLCRDLMCLFVISPSILGKLASFSPSIAKGRDYVLLETVHPLEPCILDCQSGTPSFSSSRVHASRVFHMGGSLCVTLPICIGFLQMYCCKLRH
ncbi:hypothetical protein MRX96_012193 [Rhipicephalus microplus]